MLIEHMSKLKSYDSFPIVLYDIDKTYLAKSTMYNWENEHPEWKQAKEIAFSKRLEFLETRLAVKTSGQDVKGIDARKIDAYCLMGTLRTLYSHLYSEKSEVSVEINKKLIIEGLDE